MSDFDPTRPLTMAKFKTVDGFPVTPGTPLFIVETPSKSGEVTELMARRLHAKGNAVYADDFRPTPVETEEQARAREAAGALADAALPVIEGDGSNLTEELSPELVPPADLVTWQDDDADLGKKAGDRVTKEDLITIAFREQIALTDESTKPVIIRQIVEARAAKAV
jgi:hypothetical protein